MSWSKCYFYQNKIFISFRIDGAGDLDSVDEDSVNALTPSRDSEVGRGFWFFNLQFPKKFGNTGSRGPYPLRFCNIDNDDLSAT